MTNVLKWTALLVASIISLIIIGNGYRLFRWVVGPPLLRHECELVVTDNVHLRIQAYICDMCGDPRKYEISHDAGETWEEFYTYLNNDADVFADCTEYEIISDESYVLHISDLRNSEYVVETLLTNDGGMTWNLAND